MEGKGRGGEGLWREKEGVESSENALEKICVCISTRCFPLILDYRPRFVGLEAVLKEGGSLK